MQWRRSGDNVKPLACPHCGTQAPDQIVPTGIVMGHGVSYVCANSQCGKTLWIPWGRCGLQDIERAREAEAKK